MDRERVVAMDICVALYEAAERLPSGSPWIEAFCNVAQLIEGNIEPRALPARERMRRRAIQARARFDMAPARSQAR